MANKKKIILTIGIILIIALGVFAVIKFKEKPKEVLKETTNIVVETPKEAVKEEIKEEVKEVVNLPEVSDPNKVLSSGFTLWEVKKEIDRIRTQYAKYGESKVKEEIEWTLNYLGTTMEEINRLPAELPKEPVKEEPTYENNNDNYVEQPQPSKPQQPSQPSGGGNPGGVNDWLKEYEADPDGTGTTTPYDGPPLGSWGDEP